MKWLWNYREDYVMTEVDKPKQEELSIAQCKEVESGGNWGKQSGDAIWVPAVTAAVWRCSERWASDQVVTF